jgi:predicted esterase
MNGRAFQEATDPTLHLPRILCLHGGGTNAQIFHAQCRVLSGQLKSKFRLCFADAPFLSQAGPDVVSVYQNYVPFRRWLRWQAEHPDIDAKTAVREIEKSLDTAKQEDDRKGATGEWVALLGFSQGAKMCASLLLQQQVRMQKLGIHEAKSHYRFAVLLAGRGPLVSLDPALFMTAALVDAAQIGHPDTLTNRSLGAETSHILQLPTIHVHGMQDQGLELHRDLLEQYCEPWSARLIEWDGGHRVPIKTKDVAAIAEQIFDVARQTGVLID